MLPKIQDAGSHKMWGQQPSAVQVGVARPYTLFVRVAASIVLVATLLPLGAFAQKPSSPSPTEILPPGPMQAKATTSCLECHEARIILQQRLSKGAWTKEVDKMMKWGALVDAADHDALIDYLSTNFSPDKLPYDPPRTASEKISPAKIN
jgi:hypothetical protein